MSIRSFISTSRSSSSRLLSSSSLLSSAPLLLQSSRTYTMMLRPTKILGDDTTFSDIEASIQHQQQSRGGANNTRRNNNNSSNTHHKDSGDQRAATLERRRNQQQQQRQQYQNKGGSSVNERGSGGGGSGLARQHNQGGNNNRSQFNRDRESFRRDHNKREYQNSHASSNNNNNNNNRNSRNNNSSNNNNNVSHSNNGNNNARKEESAFAQVVKEDKASSRENQERRASSPKPTESNSAPGSSSSVTNNTGNHSTSNNTTNNNTSASSNTGVEQNQQQQQQQQQQDVRQLELKLRQAHERLDKILERIKNSSTSESDPLASLANSNSASVPPPHFSSKRAVHISSQENPFIEQFFEPDEEIVAEEENGKAGKREETGSEDLLDVREPKSETKKALGKNQELTMKRTEFGIARAELVGVVTEPVKVMVDTLLNKNFVRIMLKVNFNEAPTIPKRDDRKGDKDGAAGLLEFEVRCYGEALLRACLDGGISDPNTTHTILHVAGKMMKTDKGDLVVAATEEYGSLSVIVADPK